MIEFPTNRTRGPFFAASNAVWFRAFCPSAGTGFAWKSFAPAIPAATARTTISIFFISNSNLHVTPTVYHIYRHPPFHTPRASAPEGTSGTGSRVAAPSPLHNTDPHRHDKQRSRTSVRLLVIANGRTDEI